MSDPTVFQVAYRSTANKPWSPPELNALLGVARENNKALGLTGMLLYADQSFFQVLEGPEAKVRAMVEIIGRDPRHHSLSVVLARFVHVRDLTEWSMGYVEMSLKDLSRIDGLNNFFVDSVDYTRFGKGQAMMLLNAFRNGFWRASAV